MGVPHRLPSVGKYIVEATAPTFERFVQENLALDVDQTLTVEIKLTIGAQTQTVTVTEAPPQVNTSDAYWAGPLSRTRSSACAGQSQCLLRALAHAGRDGQ